MSEPAPERTPPDTTTPAPVTIPHADEWDTARQAFEAATAGTVDLPIAGVDGGYLPIAVYHLMPEAGRRAVDALGNLLAIHDGYGEGRS